MAFRLTAGEDVGEGLRRCAIERLDHAIEGLREDEDREQAVHGARKDIKKVRSLLRLVRDDLGKTARRENDALRAASAHLAETRDAGALAGTVEDLSERFAGRLPHATWEALAVHVAGHAPDDPQAAIDAAIGLLEDVRAHAGDLPLDRVGWGTVLAGLDRTYRRGVEARSDAADLDAEHLHDWRKRGKDLWYQQRLLRDAWPAVMEVQAEEAHRLTELLGDDHDLAELARRLDEGGAAVAEQDDVLALIAHARELLQADAAALGARLYAERPKAHRRRVRRYVRVLRAEA